MSQIEITPHATILHVVSDHFHKVSGYRAYRPGGTKDFLLIYTASGLGRFGYPGGELIATPGDWVLLRPGTPHDYGVESTLKRWELLWTHFHPRPHWLEWLNWPSMHGGLMKLRLPDGEPNQKVLDRFFDIYRLSNGTLRQREMFAMNALEEVLLWCDHHNPEQAASTIDQRVCEAMDYLAKNLSKKILLDDVAEAVGLSVSRLSHLFKAETGQSPQQYLERCRIDRAADMLLRTTFSIKQISAAVGFDSPFYFSLRFKSRTKKSPKAFRESPTAVPA
jgi:AraC family transcriptional regulator of arabinose operon